MTNVIDQLFENVAYTAEWRDRKAEEYPDDARNSDAATELTRLVELQATADPKLTERYARVWEIEDATCLVETESEFLRQIGFHSTCETVDEFLSALVEKMEDEVKLHAD